MPQFIRIGFYLAWRQIRRANKWTTTLIVFVMVLTFLNLVVVSGLLVGLIEGSVVAFKSQYFGDVTISRLNKKDYIENTPMILSILNQTPEVDKYTARYSAGGKIEANYQSRIKESEIESANTTFMGIDPEKEEAVTHLSKRVIEGEYLKPDDYDKILLGSMLIKKYLPIEAPGFSQLENVAVGSKVRVKIGDIIREVTVKGIVKSKVDEISAKVFFVDKELRAIVGRQDYSVDNISMVLKPGNDPKVIRDALLRAGVGQYAKVQTFEDGQPKFLKDIKDTFALLGNMISSIGLVVASITIFIVIFINAITRRKFIGILKGIGISGKTIEFSYLIQSAFYAVAGSIIGLILLYGFLIPYVNAHPINFPFSDGILVATVVGTFWRVTLLIVATMIAGYIPARMIVRKNTLDSILGR
jgi:ABC-type lipoprotein release transport system permease subunit